jgi:hypothetical protein
MTAMPQTQFWTRTRVLALTVTAFVLVVFLGANAHLIVVSFASKPDCVLQPQSEGAAVYRAAKPSC